MKQIIQSFILLLLGLSLSSPVWAGKKAARRAQGVAIGMVNNELNKEETKQAISDGQTATTTTGNNQFSGSDGGAAASDSNLTGVLSMVSGVASIAFGAANIPPCVSLPPNFMACANVAMGFAQAASMFGQGGSSMGTRDALSDINFDWSNPELASIIGELDDGSGTLDGFIDAAKSGELEDYLSAIDNANSVINDGVAQLEERGFSVDTATGEVFDANGNRINAKASVPNSVTKNLNDVLGKVKKNHSKTLDSIAAQSKNGGAGGGSGSSSTVIIDDPFSTGEGSGIGRRGLASDSDGNKRGKDFLAGLSDGSNGGIGVEGDDIFKMMSRRYTKKIKSREFILKTK